MSRVCETILGLSSCANSLRWGVTPDWTNMCVPARIVCPWPRGWREALVGSTEGSSFAFCAWDVSLALLSFCSSTCRTSQGWWGGHTPAAPQRDGAALTWCYGDTAGWAGLVPEATSPVETFVCGDEKGRQELGDKGRGNWAPSPQ